MESLDLESKKKVEQFFNAANQTFQEIEDLNSGLKDTAKTMADSFDVKPAALMKAAKINWKNSLADEEEKMDTIRVLLSAVGVSAEMSSSPVDSLDIESKKKVEQFFASASQVFQEVADYKDGLKDTAKTLAESIDVKPAELMKAAKINWKNTLIEEEEKMDTVKTLLGVA